MLNSENQGALGRRRCCKSDSKPTLPSPDNPKLRLLNTESWQWKQKCSQWPEGYSASAPVSSSTHSASNWNITTNVTAPDGESNRKLGGKKKKKRSSRTSYLKRAQISAYELMIKFTARARAADLSLLHPSSSFQHSYTQAKQFYKAQQMWVEPTGKCTLSFGCG